jgi:replicative DNA helicase
VDYLLLLDELTHTGRLTAAGGPTHVASFLGAVPSPINAMSYAAIVARCAAMRRLISAGGKIATIGFQDRHDPKDAIAESERLLSDVLPLAPGTGPRELSDGLSEFMDALKRRPEDDGRSGSVPTGLVDLDKILNGGLSRSDLVILAARPGMGKTAMGLQMMTTLAGAYKGAALMFSLEMPMNQLVMRVLSGESGVESGRLRRNDYSDAEVRRIGMAVNGIAEMSVWVDDSTDITVAQIRDRARKQHAKTALDLIVVDHIQLIAGGRRSGGREENRTQEMSEITRQLKNMARELQVPVLALSQLSRAVEQRANKVPVLADLRDSGSLEQDADVVLFLYRDDYYDRDSERQGITDVHIAKHRNGATGQLSLIWNARTTRYLDIEVVGY